MAIAVSSATNVQRIGSEGAHQLTNEEAAALMVQLTATAAHENNPGSDNRGASRAVQWREWCSLTAIAQL
jgi:hypothetical protein